MEICTYGKMKSGVGVASMSDEAGVGGEINFSSSYGCCVRYLWLDYCCDHQYWVNPKTKSYYLFNGYAHLSSGLACGLAGLSAGMTIGIVGDAGVRGICT